MNHILKSEIKGFREGDTVMVKERCSGCEIGVLYILKYCYGYLRASDIKGVRGNIQPADCSCIDNWIKIKGDIKNYKGVNKINNLYAE